MPFEFRKLAKALAQIPARAVRIARDWYEESSELFIYRGAKVLSNVFPSFNPDFEQELLRLVQSSELSNIDFVLTILRSYEGEVFLHELARK